MDIFFQFLKKKEGGKNLSLAGRNSDDTVMGAGRPDKTNKPSPEALQYVKVSLALIRLALFLDLKLLLH